MTQGLFPYIATDPISHSKKLYSSDSRPVAPIPDWLFELLSKEGNHSLQIFSRYLLAIQRVAEDRGVKRGREEMKKEFRNLLEPTT